MLKNWGVTCKMILYACATSIVLLCTLGFFFQGQLVDMWCDGKGRPLHADEELFIRGRNARKLFRKIIRDHPELNISEFRNRRERGKSTFWFILEPHEVWMFQSFKKCARKDYIFNHFLQEYYMASKGSLVKILNEFDGYLQEEEMGGLRCNKIVPDTYSLYEFHDREAFFQRVSHELGYNTDSKQNEDEPMGECRDSHATWILKPDDLSGGKGTEILTGADLLQFVHMLKTASTCRIWRIPLLFTTFEYAPNCLIDYSVIPDREFKHVTLPGKEDDEYLLEGDIGRLYTAQRVVKLATRDWEEGNYKEKSIHLTNTHQQKIFQVLQNEDEKPQLLEEPGQLNFGMLAEYITQQGGTPAGQSGEEWLATHFWPEVGRMLECSARAMEFKMEQTGDRIKGKGFNYGIFGADILLDSEFKLWLTEIQHGPGIEITDPVKKVIIEQMFEEAFFIVREIRDDPETVDFTARKNFQWIYNELLQQ